VDDIWNEYCTNLSTAFIARINTQRYKTDALIKDSTLIRIRTFQLSARILSPIWNSINRHETPQLLNLAKSNLSAYALLIILSTNIQFKLDQFEHDDWIIKGGNIPLRSLVNDKRDLKLFRNLPPCIDTHFPIIFLDQFILPNGSQMSWSTIATLRRCLRSGPPALWFNWISHKLNVILDQPSTIHQTSPYTLWSLLDHFTSIKGSSAPWFYIDQIMTFCI